MDANDFVSSIKYHFSLIFSSNKMFSNEVELFFVKSRRTRFSLDVLYLSETYFQLVDSKQNRRMIYLVAKQPCGIINFLSEVYVRILTNQIVSISNDLLFMSGKYGLSTRHTKRDLFLDSGANFICGFYFNMCKLLTLFRMEWGGGTKRPFYQFSPVTSTKVGISPQNFLTFNFDPFMTLV